ncbi:MAG: transcription termination/antitermination NusG family protein [Paracoccaceae bacterium]|nr:transcription termination/antitermination NusG family protein [Paracoccaceae bacterium]
MAPRDGGASSVPVQNGAWYALQLRPGGLERAQTNLARQGIGWLMPQRPRTTRRAGRHINVMRPLFPGYLFIERHADSPPWRTINSTYGVAKAVCLEPGRPAEVPRALIAVLKAASTEAGEYIGDPDPFRPGDDVRVTAGPFANFIARVEAVPERDRIYVLLDMMGRDVRTTIRPGDLERV